MHKLLRALDRWNRTIVRQLARTRGHATRVKARVRARGVTGQQYFSEKRTELCKAKARTQQVWSLLLAGDWHPNYETKVPAPQPHFMRCMLTANLSVQDRMANGTFDVGVLSVVTSMYRLDLGGVAKSCSYVLRCRYARAIAAMEPRYGCVRKEEGTAREPP